MSMNALSSTGPQVAASKQEFLRYLAPPLLSKERDAINRIAEQERATIGIASLIHAAAERGLPCERVNGRKRLLLGKGSSAVTINGTSTPATTRTAKLIVRNKFRTARMLRVAGLPAPRQMCVHTWDELRAALRKVRFPVVVKPLNSNNGNGVTVLPSSETEMRRAFSLAQSFSRTVLVEEWIRGADYRFLVANGQVLAVAKRIPGHVVGDGQSSITTLVDELNRDPLRGRGHKNILTRLVIDEEAVRILAGMGRSPASVPGMGEIVYLRHIGNLSAGGIAVDVSEMVHPWNIAMALHATALTGLDVAGVDFLSPDITQPASEVGGGICEINSGPGLRLHLAPSHGTPRNVARPLITYIASLDGAWAPPVSRVR